MVRFDSLRSLGPCGAGLRWLTHSSLLDIYAVALGFVRTFFSDALPVLIPVRSTGKHCLSLSLSPTRAVMAPGAGRFKIGYGDAVDLVIT